MEGDICGKDKKLVIIEVGELGDIVYEYFSLDSSYEVVFAVEKIFKFF